mmetsp:Transcript_36236/g.113547  ORF Transcript_36236/g.113547 Transcript_36236/m.113547 type:complete len:331 (-) Transcript_36236:70-1062(-)
MRCSTSSLSHELTISPLIRSLHCHGHGLDDNGRAGVLIVAPRVHRHGLDFRDRHRLDFNHGVVPGRPRCQHMRGERRVVAQPARDGQRARLGARKGAQVHAARLRPEEEGNPRRRPVRAHGGVPPHIPEVARPLARAAQREALLGREPRRLRRVHDPLGRDHPPARASRGRGGGVGRLARPQLACDGQRRLVRRREPSDVARRLPAENLGLKGRVLVPMLLGLVDAAIAGAARLVVRERQPLLVCEPFHLVERHAWQRVALPLLGFSCCSLSKRLGRTRSTSDGEGRLFGASEHAQVARIFLAPESNVHHELVAHLAHTPEAGGALVVRE